MARAPPSPFPFHFTVSGRPTRQPETEPAVLILKRWHGMLSFLDVRLRIMTDSRDAILSWTIRRHRSLLTNRSYLTIVRQVRKARGSNAHTFQGQAIRCACSLACFRDYIRSWID